MSGRLHSEYTQVHTYMNIYRSVHYYNHTTTEPLTHTSPLVHPDSLQTSLTLVLIYSKHMRQVRLLVFW